MLIPTSSQPSNWRPSEASTPLTHSHTNAATEPSYWIDLTSKGSTSADCPRRSASARALIGCSGKTSYVKASDWVPAVQLHQKSSHRRHVALGVSCVWLCNQVYPTALAVKSLDTRWIDWLFFPSHDCWHRSFPLKAFSHVWIHME